MLTGSEGMERLEIKATAMTSKIIERVIKIGGSDGEEQVQRAYRRFDEGLNDKEILLELVGVVCSQHRKTRLLAV